MALGQVKASTQDGSTGTPVAKVVNEDTSGDAIQAICEVGSKSTWSDTSRTGLTAADAPTGGDLTTTGFAGSAGANLFDLGNAMACQIRATCNTASKVITGRLALYDGSNVCIGVSEVLTFTSDPTLRLGNASGDFVCRANILVDVAGARKARFFLDSVSGGTWAVISKPV